MSKSIIAILEAAGGKPVPTREIIRESGDYEARVVRQLKHLLFLGAIERKGLGWVLAPENNSIIPRAL